MSSRITVISLLSLLALGSTFAVTACSSSEDSADDNASDPTDDEIKKGAGVAEGGACTSAKKCKTGLVCKAHSSGPPAGAVGLPLPPSHSGGPPPGALGMPLQPGAGTCAKPADGEEGGRCNVNIQCHAGLECKYASSSSGPPPGAVGLPLPPGSASGHSSGPPPGTMGLPVIKDGECKPKSSGPPPGAVGLPLPPHG